MTPTAQQIKDARAKYGLTQVVAAELTRVKENTWKRWEGGSRVMHPAMWELFNIKAKRKRK